MQIEIWRDVVGFEDYAEVLNGFTYNKLCAQLIFH